MSAAVPLTAPETGAAIATRGKPRLERRLRSDLSRVEAAEFLDHLCRYVAYPPTLAEADLARADHVWTARSPDGRLVATTAIARVPLPGHAGGGIGLYTYMVSIDPAWRRIGLLHRFGVRSWLAEKRRAPLSPVWWLSLAGSPSGYLALARHLRGGWPRPGGTPTNRERAAMEATLIWLGTTDVLREGDLVRVVDGFGVIDPAQERSAREGGPLARYFESVNPDWRAGVDLLCVIELTMPTMLRPALDGFLRRARG